MSVPGPGGRRRNHLLTKHGGIAQRLLVEQQEHCAALASACCAKFQSVLAWLQRRPKDIEEVSSSGTRSCQFGWHFLLPANRQRKIECICVRREGSPEGKMRVLKVNSVSGRTLHVLAGEPSIGERASLRGKPLNWCGDRNVSFPIQKRKASPRDRSAGIVPEIC